MTYITLPDYFGPWESVATEEDRDYAIELLDRVNALLTEAEAHGVEIRTNNNTQTCVSGEQYGGFRPQSCPIGAANSAHKAAQAVDVFDPLNELDNWISDGILEKFDLYREAPASTKSWCHLSTRRPGSGNRTFVP